MSLDLMKWGGGGRGHAQCLIFKMKKKKSIIFPITELCGMHVRLIVCHVHGMM